MAESWAERGARLCGCGNADAHTVEREERRALDAERETASPTPVVADDEALAALPVLTVVLAAGVPCEKWPDGHWRIAGDPDPFDALVLASGPVPVLYRPGHPAAPVMADGERWHCGSQKPHAPHRGMAGGKPCDGTPLAPVVADREALAAIRERDANDWHWNGRGPRWGQVEQDRRDLLSALAAAPVVADVDAITRAVTDLADELDGWTTNPADLVERLRGIALLRGEPRG